MKRIKSINLILFVALSLFAFNATASSANKEVKKKKNEQTVVFKVNLHCHDCVRKIEGNIPYEKGVRDLKVSLEKLECEVTYRDDRTTPEKLIEAFKELGYQAKLKTDDSPSEKAKLNNGHIQ
jgi:periplasmic mercuric ion binding protein